MKSIIILIVASQGYQPIEYGHTRKVLEEAGFEVKVASNLPTQAHATPSEPASGYATASVDLVVSDITPDKYDGIFIIGGSGALTCLNNSETYNVMKKAAQAGKPFGAICISPRILTAAGLLTGKKATGWNGDKELDDVFKKAGVTYLKEPVVTDGNNIVTADGPGSAKAFGKAIVAVVQK